MQPTPNGRQPVLATDENFNEEDYLATNPDVAEAVLDGRIRSGRLHFERYGRDEQRPIVLRSQRSGRLDALELWIARAVARLGKLLPAPVARGMQRHRQRRASMLARLQSLEARLEDTEVLVDQLLTILRRESGLPPPPPKHLQVRVVGSYSSDFVESGFESVYPDLNRALSKAGRRLEELSSILDFGCGCGRAIRALATLLPGCELHGIDVDPVAIDWLERNYSRFGRFSVAPHRPPTSFADDSFDLVFGISVLTHLPEDMQFDWLTELARITKPGGHVILTIHGPSFHEKLAPEIRNEIHKKGFYYSDFGSNYGTSISLPDFYQTAFHSHDYVRRAWSRYFAVLDIEPLGLQDYQDIVLLHNVVATSIPPNSTSDAS